MSGKILPDDTLALYDDNGDLKTHHGVYVLADNGRFRMIPHPHH
jgi:hypothetical protein